MHQMGRRQITYSQVRWYISKSSQKLYIKFYVQSLNTLANTCYKSRSTLLSTTTTSLFKPHVVVVEIRARRHHHRRRCDTYGRLNLGQGDVYIATNALWSEAHFHPIKCTNTQFISPLQDELILLCPVNLACRRMDSCVVQTSTTRRGII